MLVLLHRFNKYPQSTVLFIISQQTNYSLNSLIYYQGLNQRVVAQPYTVYQAFILR